MKIAILGIVLLVTAISLVGLNYTGAVASEKGYCDCIYQRMETKGFIRELQIETYKVRTTDAVDDALCNKRCPILVGKRGTVMGKAEPYVATVRICQLKKCCDCLTTNFDIDYMPYNTFADKIWITPYASTVQPDSRCQKTCKEIFGSLRIRPLKR
jgi:hypothetical protein